MGLSNCLVTNTRPLPAMLVPPRGFILHFSPDPGKMKKREVTGMAEWALILWLEYGAVMFTAPSTFPSEVQCQVKAAQLLNDLERIVVHLDLGDYGTLCAER